MRKVSHRPRPRLEALEDRCTPATFIVNTLADTVDKDLTDGMALDENGNTSLRAAIQQANAPASPGQDIIQFASWLTGTISLAIGLDPLASSIFIDGPGASGNYRITVARAAGAADFGIFRVNQGADCTIEGLDITGGTGISGHGIWNRGTLSVQDCLIHGNAAFNGGGIYNAFFANLSLANTWVYSNSASDLGGGIYNAAEAVTSLYAGSRVHDNFASRHGGGVYSEGRLDIIDTRIFSNEAGLHGGGLYSSGALDCRDSWLEENTAGGNGGGVYLTDAASTATFVNALIRWNGANKGGGRMSKTAPQPSTTAP
jgi:hypothetical protein